MKNKIKSFLSYLFFPLAIIINLKTISFWRVIKEVVSSDIMTFSFKKRIGSFRCSGLPKIKGKKYINFDCNFSCGETNRIEAYDSYRGFLYSPRIKFGKNVYIGNNCHIGAINSILINDNVLIGSNVLIIDHDHGGTNDLSCEPISRKLISKGEIIVGKNCWIGENVSILSNVKIGDNCVIGANTLLVNCDIPSNSIVVGNPAKIIKRYEQ